MEMPIVQPAVSRLGTAAESVEGESRSKAEEGDRYAGRPDDMQIFPPVPERLPVAGSEIDRGLISAKSRN